jgi:hypothetical protein
MKQPDVICYLADRPYTNPIPPRDLDKITQINYAFGRIEGQKISVRHLRHYDQL